MKGPGKHNSFNISRLGSGYIAKIFGGLLMGLGWLLSPLTWWNDWVINLPLAWLVSSWIVKTSEKSFEFFFILFYWLTNLGGFLLMYFGWRIFQLRNPLSKKEMAVSFFVSLAYTVVILILIKLGFLKPISIQR
jgi:hypothetical protein